MLKQQISPSMMCADYRAFTELLKTFEVTGIEYLHIDVMDGVFVKNYTLGTDFCERLRAMTEIPLDIHLMITEPEWKIDWFKPRAGEYVSVHAEATNHLQRALAAIRKYGAKPMAALLRFIFCISLSYWPPDSTASGTPLMKPLKTIPL